VRNILIVEDNVVLRGLLAELVTDEGMRATVASTVDEAMSRLGEQEFEAVLLDIQLGEQSGVTILDALSSSPSSPKVVAMSASPREAVIAKQFGITFVTKPFGLEEIVQALSSATRPVRS